jgi:hypothetical protein
VFLWLPAPSRRVPGTRAVSCISFYPLPPPIVGASSITRCSPQAALLNPPLPIGGTSDPLPAETTAHLPQCELGWTLCGGSKVQYDCIYIFHQILGALGWVVKVPEIRVIAVFEVENGCLTWVIDQ